MILIDANLLLYAHDSTSEHHIQARRWLERTFSGVEPVCLAWVTVLAFLRIVTHPNALRRPLSVASTVSLVSEWFEQPAVQVVEPTLRHWELLKDLVVEAQANGPLVMDAHLAALTLEHGAVLYTRDRAFRRFQGVRVVDPLESTAGLRARKRPEPKEP